MNDANHGPEDLVEPVVIWATRGFDGYTFALDVEDRDRLLEQTGGQVAPTARVTVALDTQNEFETVFGPIEPQVVILLTGLSQDRLGALGGIEVRDSKSDQVLWRYPAQAA